MKILDIKNLNRLAKERLITMISVLDIFGAEYDISSDENFVEVKIEPKLSYNGKLFKVPKEALNDEDFCLKFYFSELD